MPRAALLSAAVVFLCAAPCSAGIAVPANTTLKAHRRHIREQMMREKERLLRQCKRDRTCPYAKASASRANCVDGKAVVGADTYDCKDIDLLSYVNSADLGSATRGNDIWGWEDPETGHEIAIHQMVDGTSFVDVTDAENPVVLGYMRSVVWPLEASWRDAKVYKNHVYIVADISDHGMQVYDMTQLRPLYGRKGVVVPLLEPDMVYHEFGASHNIVINEDTGFAYSVGGRRQDGGCEGHQRKCACGPHVMDIRDPANPVFVGCFADDGYTHDAECVVYHGPDTRYSGKELCFCYNEDTLTVVDMSDKQKMSLISRTEYKDNYYSHQGWLTADHSHLLLNDEQDETRSGDPRTRTLLWDATDLTAPVNIGVHQPGHTTIDHNLYITTEDKAYMSQYCSGLRVIDVSSIATGVTPEVGYFDMAPYCSNQTVFQGTWSNFPFFRSGIVVVNSIELGLFVLRPKWRAPGAKTVYRP